MSVKILCKSYGINEGVLDLRDKRISELPESISKLISLEVLYLSHNRLTALPESIGNLINLKVLYLNHKLPFGCVIKYF